jgi:ribosomal protein S5
VTPFPSTRRLFHATAPVRNRNRKPRRFRHGKPAPRPSLDPAPAVDPVASAPPLTWRAAERAADREPQREKMRAKIKDAMRPYTEEELEALAQYYTPAQMEALRAAEESVDVADVMEQWGARKDQFKLDYLDDMSQIDPFVDKKPQLHVGHAPVFRMRLPTTDNMTTEDWEKHDAEMQDWEEKIQDARPGQLSLKEIQKRAANRQAFGVWLSEMEEAKAKQFADQKSKDPNWEPKPEDMQSWSTKVQDKLRELGIADEFEADDGHPSQLEELKKNQRMFLEHKAFVESKIDETLEEYRDLQKGKDGKDTVGLKAKIHEQLRSLVQQLQGLKAVEEADRVDDAPDHAIANNEFFDHVAESVMYDGMSVDDMLYHIERSQLDDKAKASVRPIRMLKDVDRQRAKAALFPIVKLVDKQFPIPPEAGLSIKDLFEEVDQLDMDPIKKHELLAYSHWAGTPKEESLRKWLERTIASHPRLPDARTAEEKLTHDSYERITKRLGFNPNDDLWFVDGPNKSLYSREIYSALAAPIPKIKDPGATYPSGVSDALAVAYARLAKQMGVEVAYLRKFKVKKLVVKRVVNQTRKGKIGSFYSLSVAGNQNGILGIGAGKSAEMEDSILQSRLMALRNLAPVLRYEGRTIYGELNKKVGGTTVQLSARPPGVYRSLSLASLIRSGFGLRTQSLVYEVAQMAGIRDLSARVGRSRNPMNTVKATYEALMAQRLPDDIARARGRKLVDVRKVYYGRTVL